MIGWQREFSGRAAGIRTYAAVCLGSCAFTVVGQVGGNGDVDPTRVAAQIVSGIGFIGGGVILHQRGRTRGLTTAATIWACAAVGMAQGFGLHILAGLTSAMLVVLLWAAETQFWKSLSPKDPSAPEPCPAEDDKES